MNYEIIVEEFVLQVEVTYCDNRPPQPNNRDSDWDCMGTRELEFKVLSGITYDDDGVRMDVRAYDCLVAGRKHAKQIELSLWQQIDSRQRRERRAA